MMLNAGSYAGNHCLDIHIPRARRSLVPYRIADSLFFSTNTPVMMNEAKTYHALLLRTGYE